MLPVCCAFAYAIELSLRTFAATAALIGAARLALISDMAARSGSSSPASSLSSSRVSGLYWISSVLGSTPSGLRLLADRVVLDRAGAGGRVVRQHVQRGGEVHRHGEVRIHERHRGALGQLLAGELHELVLAQRAILLAHLAS